MNGCRLDRWAVDAPLTGICVERGGRYAAFAGGDGCVRVVDLQDRELALSALSLTSGAILALVADSRAPAFICGADNGAVYRVHAVEGSRELARFTRPWPDQLATHPCGLRAVSEGPQVRVLDAGGQTVTELGDHPSTVAGLASDSSGRRLAVSHYNGVSLWTLDGRCGEPHRLYHRGSHLDLSWRSDERFVVTATQEKTIHAWDLVSGQDTSLGPCMSKVKSISWSADGSWLLASGTDTVSCWLFSTGRLPPAAPRMLGRYSEHLVARVSANPRHALIAAGYNDGGLDLVSLAPRPQRRALTSAPGSPIAGLAWSPDGNCLLGGDSDGRVFVCRFETDVLARLA
ncbi:MAG: hypothetical protein OXE86_04925 [Alphaproteobacteria bacterium]|nr:hypothetical protein [Alphaproteobacteria bacterium]